MFFYYLLPTKNVQLVSSAVTQLGSSIHQCFCSAIRDSQQPISPIGFLFLKLPQPPCAVLLVYPFNLASTLKWNFWNPAWDKLHIHWCRIWSNSMKFGFFGVWSSWPLCEGRAWKGHERYQQSSWTEKTTQKSDTKTYFPSPTEQTSRVTKPLSFWQGNLQKTQTKHFFLQISSYKHFGPCHRDKKWDLAFEIM